MDTTNQTQLQNPPQTPGVDGRSWLWLLAGLVAFGLLLATGALFVEARSQADIFTGTVAGAAGSVYLRTRPQPVSSVVSLLNPGDRLQARSSRDVEGTLWYEVRTAQGDGWLPASRVERDGWRFIIGVRVR